MARQPLLIPAALLALAASAAGARAATRAGRSLRFLRSLDPCAGNSCSCCACDGFSDCKVPDDPIEHIQGELDNAKDTLNEWQEKAAEEAEDLWDDASEVFETVAENVSDGVMDPTRPYREWAKRLEDLLEIDFNSCSDPIAEEKQGGWTVIHGNRIWDSRTAYTALAAVFPVTTASAGAVLYDEYQKQIKAATESAEAAGEEVVEIVRKAVENLVNQLVAFTSGNAPDLCTPLDTLDLKMKIVRANCEFHLDEIAGRLGESGVDALPSEGWFTWVIGFRARSSGASTTCDGRNGEQVVAPPPPKNPPSTSSDESEIEKPIITGANCDCPSSWIGDGECDSTCNNYACNYDDGDCDDDDPAAQNDDDPAQNENPAQNDVSTPPSCLSNPMFECRDLVRLNTVSKFCTSSTGPMSFRDSDGTVYYGDVTLRTSSEGRVTFDDGAEWTCNKLATILFVERWRCVIVEHPNPRVQGMTHEGTCHGVR